MKKVAIYGGSFNPPHLGHYNAAKQFYKVTGADELIIVPSFIPPHKVQCDFADAAARLKMCELAFSSIPNTIVSDIEIARGGKSYTYLTLEHFHTQNTELYFLVGTDMLLTLDEWMCAEKIFQYATICFFRRENDREKTVEIEKKLALLRSHYNARIIEIDGDVIQVSSTEIREMVKRGEDVSPYVSAEVHEYIKAMRIYS